MTEVGSVIGIATATETGGTTVRDAHPWAGHPLPGHAHPRVTCPEIFGIETEIAFLESSPTDRDETHAITAHYPEYHLRQNRLMACLHLNGVEHS